MRQKAKKIFKTSLGWAGVAGSEQGICSVVLPKKEKKTVQRRLAGFPPSTKGGSGESERILRETEKLLRKYFSGGRVSFDLPLDISYYTDFQRAVWKAACEIPCGEIRSYAWIAKRIGKPRAARAVGQAMGANPIPIIIP